MRNLARLPRRPSEILHHLPDVIDVERMRALGMRAEQMRDPSL
jgi:hypothetical protein